MTEIRARNRTKRDREWDLDNEIEKQTYCKKYNDIVGGFLFWFESVIVMDDLTEQRNRSEGKDLEFRFARNGELRVKDLLWGEMIKRVVS